MSQHSNGKLDIYIYGGPVYSKLRNNRTVAINSFVINDYETKEQVNEQGLWGMGIGHSYKNIFNAPFIFSIGLAGYSVNLGRVAGTEYPFINDDVYDTLNYQFTVKSRGLLAEARLFYTDFVWQPFLLAGVGSAWNTLGHYNEVPTVPSLSAAASANKFLSQTNNALAYELGLGLQHKIYEDITHSIAYSGTLDYRYANFGKGMLTSFLTQTTEQTLQIKSLNAQGIVFSLKASFG